MSTKSKTVFITGASTGIGYALAAEFAQRGGYKVYAGARTTEKLKSLEELGVKILHFDITSKESIENAKTLISAENNDSLDILYNNAGIHNIQPIFDVESDVVRRVFDVNVFGHFDVLKSFKSLLLNSRGLVAFTDSVVDLVPFPFTSAYTASKGAFDLLAKTFALETNNLGIKVLVVKTGLVKTEILSPFKIPSDSVYYLEDEEILKEMEGPQTSAADYAKQVVSDVEHSIKKGALYAETYRGKSALLAYYLNWLLPFWLYIKIAIPILGLSGVYKKIAEKNNKQKTA